MPLMSANENGNSITIPERESAMPPSTTVQKISFWPALNACGHVRPEKKK
jgi:hypothetical protein